MLLCTCTLSTGDDKTITARGLFLVAPLPLSRLLSASRPQALLRALFIPRTLQAGRLAQGNPRISCTQPAVLSRTSTAPNGDAIGNKLQRHGGGRIFPAMLPDLSNFDVGFGVESASSIRCRQWLQSVCCGRSTESTQGSLVGPNCDIQKWINRATACEIDPGRVAYSAPCA
jgi:hypothetical protein